MIQKQVIFNAKDLTKSAQEVLNMIKRPKLTPLSRCNPKSIADRKNLPTYRPLTKEQRKAVEDKISRLLIEKKEVP